MVDELAMAPAGWMLPLRTGIRLIDHYESRGRYASAEDIRFDLLDAYRSGVISRPMVSCAWVRFNVPASQLDCVQLQNGDRMESRCTREVGRGIASSRYQIGSINAPGHHVAQPFMAGNQEGRDSIQALQGLSHWAFQIVPAQGEGPEGPRLLERAAFSSRKRLGYRMTNPRCLQARNRQARADDPFRVYIKWDSAL